MIYPGSIMFFRWEKYRLVTLLESFVIFHFSTIIAVIVRFDLNGFHAIYGTSTMKAEPFLTPPSLISVFFYESPSRILGGRLRC